MLILFLAGLMVGVFALVALLTVGMIRELLHWQNELLFHRPARRRAP